VYAPTVELLRVGGGTRALTPHLELTGERTIPAA